MSTHLDELNRLLKGIQELSKLNLTLEQKLIIDELLEPTTEEVIVDSVDSINNFMPDPALKEIFTQIHHSVVINALNKHLKARFNPDIKIQFMSTEFAGTTSDITKRLIRGDMVAKLQPLNENDELTDFVVIEFQYEHNSEVPFRIHAYGSNHLKAISLEVNDIKNRKTVKIKKKVYMRPLELIIYTSEKLNKKQSVHEFNTTAKHFKFNGRNKYAKNGDVITHLIPYVNILKMDLDELNKSAFSFLQCIYLYKYKQNMDLIKPGELVKVTKTIEENLSKLLSKEDYDLVMKHHINLIEDLCNLMSKQPKKFGNEVKTMDYMRNTFAGRIEANALEEGIGIGVEKGIDIGVEKGIGIGVEKGIGIGVEKGIGIGVEKGIEKIISTLLENLSVTNVAEMTKLSIEEVTRIRDSIAT